MWRKNRWNNSMAKHAGPSYCPMSLSPSTWPAINSNLLSPKQKTVSTTRLLSQACILHLCSLLGTSADFSSTLDLNGWECSWNDVRYVLRFERIWACLQSQIPAFCAMIAQCSNQWDLTSSHHLSPFATWIPWCCPSGWELWRTLWRKASRWSWEPPQRSRGRRWTSCMRDYKISSTLDCIEWTGQHGPSWRHRAAQPVDAQGCLLRVCSYLHISADPLYVPVWKGMQ